VEEAESKARETYAQAEDYRKRMTQDRKRREDEIFRLRAEVSKTPSCSISPNSYYTSQVAQFRTSQHRDEALTVHPSQQQQSTAEGASYSDEEDKEDLLMPAASVRVDNDDDYMQDRTDEEPAKQPDDGGKHNIDEEGEEIRRGLNHEKGKGRAFVVEDEGMRRSRASINGNDADDEDEDDGGGQEGRAADWMPFEEPMEDVDEEQDAGEQYYSEEGRGEEEEVAEELVEELESPHVNRVHARQPTKFTRPKGGQGPPLKVRFTKSPAQSSSFTVPTGQDEDLSIQQMFHLMLKNLNDLQDRMDGEEPRSTTCRENQHSTHSRFKRPREISARTSQRTLLLVSNEFQR
jgi:hypothetical protein